MLNIIKVHTANASYIYDINNATKLIDDELSQGQLIIIQIITMLITDVMRYSKSVTSAQLQ